MKLYQQIVELLENNPQVPFNISDLIEELQLSENQASKLDEVIELLIENRKAIRIADHYLMSYDTRKWVIGRLKIKDANYGFLIPAANEVEDFYVPSYAFHNAHHDDRVLALIHQYSFGRMEAEIVRVLEKSKRAVTGMFIGSSSSGFVVPDKLPGVKRILIASGHTFDAKDKQMVEVELFPNQQLMETMRGKIVGVLGYPGNLATERATLLRMHGFPIRFSNSVEQYVNAINPELQEADDLYRKDYTHLTTCTIDPVDAKDFDDALSLEPVEDGWLAAVHIADVSHYVPVGTTLDEEARERATSVYLPQGVLPMLPERLSGDLCSLRPNEKRRALSVFFQFDQNGKLIQKWIERTWICSKFRFHYEQVQAIYDLYDENNDEDTYWKENIQAYVVGSWEYRLVGLRWFARLFRKERLSKGGIEFESTEVEIDLDKEGKPKSIKPKEHFESHHVIEEWMLLANRTVTESFHSITKRKYPFIYRVHEEPDEEKLEEFLLIASDLGYPWTGGNPKNSRDFQRYIQKLKTVPEAPILMDLAIRSMMRAHYSTVNVGHFGLGFDHYTHFTSPIRRYPDLIVHRLVIQHILEKKKITNRKAWTDTLRNLAKHCSEREEAATQAERDGIRWKQVEYYSTRIGKEFDAIIVAIQPRGMFIELIDTLTSTFLPCSDLSSEEFAFDPKKHVLKGRKSGTIYKLGDRIRVMILKADEKTHKLTVTLTAKLTPIKNQKEAATRTKKKKETQSLKLKSKVRSKTKKITRKRDRRKRK
ncbi:MAG: ribonuclease R [bacterium]|nr:ribonuclease R [bacterium]